MKKISWHAPEYIHTPKTNDWYWVVGIVTISAAIISIILNNVIFAILILVSSFTLSLFATRKPEIINFEIDNLGIKANKTLHKYDELEYFWVETEDAYPRIIIKSKKKLSLYITFLIEGVDPKGVRDVLVEYLPETKITEPLLEKILIYFGF